MDFFILVTGTDAGEREDYMTEKIREYSMNGALIIGVDNGYGNMKTARRCFKTAIAKYDSAPVLSRDYIEYDGGYYVIGEGRKGFVADKQTDDDNYMLTLAAIVKELEARGMTDSVNRARIHLAVGLPLKWVRHRGRTLRDICLETAVWRSAIRTDFIVLSLQDVRLCRSVTRQ